MKTFNEIPFVPELLDILFPQLGGNLNCVKVQDFGTMSGLLEVDEDTFMRWPNAGKRKLQAFKEVQHFLSTSEGQAKALEVYESCFETHFFPENLTIAQEELSLENKIGLAIEQYVCALEKVSEYYPAVEENIRRIKLLFVEQFSKREVAKELAIGEERVRQVKIELLEKMSDGKFRYAGNLKFSDSLKKDVEHFMEHLPPICSEKTLCGLLQCSAYDESAASAILPLKSAPTESYQLSSDSAYSHFDQLYYFSPGGSVAWVKTYMKAVYGVLGGETKKGKESDIRPLGIDDIMDMLEKNNPKFEFDRNVVSSILEQHTRVESLIMDDEAKFQIKYEFLNDYQSIGRIVFENKRVVTSDIDTIHKDRMKGIQSDSISNSIENAKKNFTWIVGGGLNGILEYNETGEGRLNLRKAVREWVGSQTLFTIDDVLSALKEKGYSDFSELTVRAYVLEDCHVDNKDDNLFCNSECVGLFSENHSWRNKTQCGLNNWIIRNVHSYLMSQPSFELPVNEVDKRIKADAALSEDKFVIRRDIPNYLLPFMKGEQALFAYDNKKLKLTEYARTLSDGELSKVGLRSRKPDYYDVVVAKIVSLLNESSNGELRLRDLQKECLEDIGDTATASFYKIVDGYLPKQISKVFKDGKAYLKLEKDKVEYVDSMIVKPVLDDNVQIEEVVKAEVERPVREIGKQIEIDWAVLREDLCFQLAYNSRRWGCELSFDASVDKFLRFIQHLDTKENARLAIQLPRNFTQLWHYQNDLYSYLGYLTDIVICYERLLREIHKANTGEEIATVGLVDTVNMIDDIRVWSSMDDDDPFRKTLRFLRRDRNKLTHGEELLKGLSEIVMATSNYISLYIYTVSKFWNEDCA